MHYFKSVMRYEYVLLLLAICLGGCSHRDYKSAAQQCMQMLKERGEIPRDATLHTAFKPPDNENSHLQHLYIKYDSQQQTYMPGVCILDNGKVSVSQTVRVVAEEMKTYLQVCQTARVCTQWCGRRYTKYREPSAAERADMCALKTAEEYIKGGQFWISLWPL